MINLPEEVKTVLETLMQHDYHAYIVGGCVRDTLIGLTPKDWDITTSAEPNEVIRIFESQGFRVVPTGIKYGTVTVLINGIPLEVTTFRKDGNYGDGRRPDDVTFSTSVYEDLSRRDFTMNAIAYNDYDGFIDPFEGIKDINYRKIRAVGNPGERISEDALRMMRAMRFALTKHFVIEGSLYVSILNNCEKIGVVSQERIRDELVKMMEVNPSSAIQILDSGDLLKYILPEVEAMKDVPQRNPGHVYDVFNHTMMALSASTYPWWIGSKKDITTTLAVLLHDIGKPSTHSTIDGIDHFYGHAEASVKIAEDVLNRLHFERKLINDVKALILNHDATVEKKVTVKRLMELLQTPEQFDRWLNLRYADVSGQNPEIQNERFALLARIAAWHDEIINTKEPFGLKNLAVTGDDVMRILHIKPGRKVGDVLQGCLSLVLENPDANNLPFLEEYIANNF